MSENLILTLVANSTSSLSRFARAYVFTMLCTGGATYAGMVVLLMQAAQPDWVFSLVMSVIFMVVIMFGAALPVAVVVGILFLAFAK